MVNTQSTYLGFSYKNEFVFFNDDDQINDQINCSMTDSVIQKIKTFGRLENGWHFGDGLSPTDSLIKKTIDLYCLIITSPCISDECKIDAFPNIDGGITLSIGVSDNFIELIINPDFSADLTKEKGFGMDYEVLEEIEGIDIENSGFILTYIYSICNLLEPSTSTDMLNTKEDLKATYSRTWGKEFLYSRRSARNQPVIPSVSTSRGSIKILQETL